jgi:hypothetical protein
LYDTKVTRTQFDRSSATSAKELTIEEGEGMRHQTSFYQDDGRNIKINITKVT